MNRRKKSTRVVLLTVYQGADTLEGRRDIAKWLRMRASHLLKHGKDYSKRFTASFNWLKEKK